MKSEKMSRREAMARLSKVLAIAFGLNEADIINLLAQIQKPGSGFNAAKLANIRTLNAQAQAIKVLVIGTRDVFVNEYGRDPIFDPANFTGKGCSILFSSGRSVFNDVSTCDKNTCGEQTCGTLVYCPDNNCGTQDCPKLKVQINTNLFSPEVLNSLKSDPFVSSLFKEFNVTTTRELSQKLQSIIRQRRVEVPNR
jgi:hypothetical protein